MENKIVYIFCAFALLVQVAHSQVLSTKPIISNPINPIIGTNIGGVLNTGNLGNVISSNVIGGAAAGNLIGGAVAGNVIGGAVAGNAVARGPLTVTSVSPIGPSGLAVASENVLEGVLTVSGQLPFLSSVGFEGSLPTSGSGVATCGCGNGQVAITGEGLPNGVRL